MNIKKKIIFTGLSLLLSNAFNSVYSGESAEKNLDDAMNLSRKQPSHINYLDLDLNQLQGLLPIDDDTIKDDSAFMLFDDDPLQQENSSVSTGNEEDDNFDFCFSAEDFNQELFELLANSILTQDISTNSSDAADKAQPSTQGAPAEWSIFSIMQKTIGDKEPTKKMEEIERRNNAIKEFIGQHKEQNQSTKLTYPKILEGLQPQYHDLTLRQIARFFEKNPELRTSKRSQEDKERIQERNEAIRQFILQHKAQNPSTKLTYMEILESLKPQYPDLTFPLIQHFLENNPSLRTSRNSQEDVATNSSDAADTAQASGQPLEKSGRKARTKTMRRSVQEIETRNEAIREFIAQHKEQNPSTNLTYAEIQSGLEDKYPGLTLKQLERFFKNNKSLRTSINSQESIERKKTINEAIIEFIAQHNAQNPSTELTNRKILEGLKSQYPELTIGHIYYFYSKNQSSRTSKKSQNNAQPAIVDAAVTLAAMGQQGLIPENATTYGKRLNEATQEQTVSSNKRTKTS